MPQKDPYGTMRASRRIGGAKAAEADVEEFFENLIYFTEVNSKHNSKHISLAAIDFMLVL